MATYARTLRRGLPRQRGGDAWPPQGDAPVELGAGSVEAPVTDGADATSVAEMSVEAPRTPELPESGVEVTDAAAAPLPEERSAVVAADVAAPAAAPVAAIRRGLPRVAGGEPWPPAGAAPAASARAEPEGMPATAPGAPAAAAAASAPVEPAAASTVTAPARPAVRRGLPRPGTAAPAVAAGTVAASGVVEPAAPVTPAAVEQPAAAASVATAPAARPPAAQPSRAPLARPAPARPPVSARPRPPSAPARKPGRFGDYTPGQLVGAAVVGGFGLLLAATFAVVAVGWFIGLPFMREFLATYPGEYELPEGAPVGFPAWLGWQHFFNVFLIVLIIRSGLRVRTEKRPDAYWTPRWSKTRKISLALWFHQSLDILWIVNGVVFVVLLFVTGQWLRIVPTSWEVFPNAISATLQYVSLDWPTENGWVNYNSLQQLTYFATVFIAAPLAVITGVRMSGIWPKDAKTLNRVYPVEWARAVHFPVMLYFVAFILVHVGLVLATGALRNLNHMYASQDAVNWVGFWIFFASLVVIAAAWIAARPSILAPIAGLFGKVGR